LLPFDPGIFALHLGPHPGSLWVTWSLDPTALIGIPLAWILYTRGLHTLGPEPGYHRRWRTRAFYAGLVTLFVALVSPLDALSDELFSVHMVQHLLLMMVGAPLVLLGAPMIPMMRGVPRRFRRSLLIPVARSKVVRLPLRLLTRPLVAWPIFVGMLFVWHQPAVFEAALGNEALHLLEHASFAMGGYLFWWNVVDPHPLKPNLPYLVRVPYVFITMIPNFTLAAFLTFAQSAWYPTYAESVLRHGFTAIEDQQLGGVVMWIPGSFIFGAALVLSLFAAARAEQAAQLALEAERD
jgi:putative membrane protein